jgi:nucleoside-diphosphate-sugar epimerase
MSAIKSVVIVGGSGKIAVELTRRLLARQPPPQITSIIRSTSSPSFKSLEELPHYNTDVLKPVISSLESSTVQEFVNIFKQAKADVVVFSAGAGGKASSDGISSDERTKKVDYEGAVKVFDALELVQEHGLNPRLVLVSTIDSRDLNIKPPHYVRFFSNDLLLLFR